MKFSITKHKNAKKFGEHSEDKAAYFLELRGYQIINRNFHGVQGEIDIIALDPYTNETIFVEVKARKDESFCSIYRSIPRSKKRKIMLAAEEWFLKNKTDLQFPEFRIDAIFIIKEDSIEHIKNI